jgi:hypothetical protein
MDTMDGMDKNGLLNGQWTMDDGQWTEIMSRLSGLIPTSPIRPIYLIRLIRQICRRKQQTRSQIRVPFHPSKQQPIEKIFRVFRAFRGQKMGCGH